MVDNRNSVLGEASVCSILRFAFWEIFFLPLTLAAGVSKGIDSGINHFCTNISPKGNY